MSDGNGKRTNGSAYRDFQGKVEQTISRSEPWWPPRMTAPAGAPNVVVILVDDVGYSDLGCFGSEIPTPHLDAIARGGFRFTDFHVMPLCSPTRAALLTGRNAHAAGIGHVANVDPGFPGYASELPANQPSMAEAFRDGGYTTLAVGKWHLCKDSDLAEGGDKHSWPLQRGFDQYYGFLEALTNFHHPHRLYDGNSVVEVDEYPDNYYLTDDLTDRAIQMLRRAKTDRPDKPVFLYFAHGAVHAPLHARRADIERHRGRYAQGWDRLREERLARQLELGIVPAGTELPPRNSEPGEHVPAWDSLSEAEQTVFARYMEIYAAMVETIDESTGRLRGALDELGELDNTIFVFLSDNGASREGRVYGTSSYFRDGGTGASDGTPVNDEDLANLDALGGPTTWPHYPRGWAMACNTPFRLYKITTFRGGHQVPFIISWPARYASTDGAVRRQYAHVTDLLPTLAELAGISVPTERHGQPADPLAGESLATLLDDADAPSRHTEQYTECIGNRSYYRDGWEVVTFHPPMTPFREDRWQLFHVADDINQRHDVADEHPDLVKELASAWDDAAWANQVFPLDDGTRLVHLQRPPDEHFTRPVKIVPGTPTLERYRSAQLIGSRSFQVIVDLEYGPGDQGVLVAHGGQESGYVLYVEDGALRFEFNGYGVMRSLTAPLERACRSIVVDVTAQPKRTWDLDIRVDDQVVAGDGGYVQWAGFLPYEGIDVGVDRRSPVSWSLFERHGAFPYRGTLHSVSYVPGELAPDAGLVRLEQARALGLALD